MSRRKKVPEAMGLSALDLFSGLFGLIVLLYSLAPLEDGYPEPYEQTIYFISVEVANRVGHKIGLSFKSNGVRYESWPKCSDDGPVRWITCKPGLLEVAIEGEKPEKKLWVTIEKLFSNDVPEEILVRVTTRDGEKSEKLTFSGNRYRKVVEIL